MRPNPPVERDSPEAGCPSLLRWAPKETMSLIRTAFLALLVGYLQPALAEPTAETLYEDCSAFHIPSRSRKADNWVKLKRCENIVVNTVRGLDWPLQVPSKTKWPGGATTNDILICPTDVTAYSENKLIEFFLKYWDQKGLGYLSGKAHSAQEAAVEAFTSQFADCAKK